MNNTINYVINLDRRVDRWAVIREHLAEQGLRVTRFSAIDNGWKGCRDSHLAIMELCKEKVCFSIIEDDALFLQDLNYATEALTQLPKDWDCLYLGASPQQPQERYSENLFRLKNAWTTHFIIWHNRKDGAVEYILTHKNEIEKIDVFMAKIIQEKFNCFVTFPLIATQRQTQSDTCRRSDVSTIEKNYNLYCK